MSTVLFSLTATIPLLGHGGIVAAQGEAAESAEQSVHYVAATLRAYRNSGRFADNPGIDEADMGRFIELPEDIQVRFPRNIGPDSPMCNFYRDPENARMTIEERAGIAHGFLPSLENRLRRYVEIDAAFRDALVDNFGSRALERINRIRSESVSSAMLPIREYDEAARIAFADSMCM